MTRALVVGGAACLESDLLALADLTFDLRVGINDALYTFSNIDAAATLHPEHVPGWLEIRRAWGWPDVPIYTMDRAHGGAPPMRIWRTDNADFDPIWTGGSSGLYAVGVALNALGADEVWLVGVPMDAQPNRYRDEGGWQQYQRYRRRWVKAHEGGWLGRVRSASGWTRELLGAGTLGSIPEAA